MPIPETSTECLRTSASRAIVEGADGWESEDLEGLWVPRSLRRLVFCWLIRCANMETTEGSADRALELQELQL